MIFVWLFQGLITSRVSYEPALMYEVLFNYCVTNEQSFNPLEPLLIKLMFRIFFRCRSITKSTKLTTTQENPVFYAYSKNFTILYQGKL